MNVRSIQTLFQFTNRFILGLTIACSLSSADLTADEYRTTCNFNDELCGWVEIASEPNLTEPGSTAADEAFEKSITTIVAAVGASTGVSLQQIIEPFAMVGPQLEDSSRMVHELDRWWKSVVKFGKTLSSSSTDLAIKDVAALEPIDVDALGPSILVQSDDIATVIDQPTTGIEVTPIDSLVGSAPMIATIDVPYLPYDLSASDIRLRSVFPMTTKAFCVRSRVAQWNPVPMWTATDRSGDDPPFELAVAGPVDCWMEELISKIDQWTAPESSIRANLTPQSIGAKLASLTVGSNQLVSDATKLIASYWPQPVAKPSQTGLALLIRANAVIEIPPAEPAAAQIAETISNAMLR